MIERCRKIPGCAGTSEQLRTGAASLQQGYLHWELSKLRDQLQRRQGDRTGFLLLLVMALDRHSRELPGSIPSSSWVPTSLGQRHHPSNKLPQQPSQPKQILQTKCKYSCKENVAFGGDFPPLLGTGNKIMFFKWLILKTLHFHFNSPKFIPWNNLLGRCVKGGGCHLLTPSNTWSFTTVLHIRSCLHQ